MADEDVPTTCTLIHLSREFGSQRSAGEVPMTTPHGIRPLTPETFSAWLALAQKHNGVWGGCYCSYFHGDTEQTIKSH